MFFSFFFFFTQFHLTVNCEISIYFLFISDWEERQSLKYNVAVTQGLQSSWRIVIFVFQAPVWGSVSGL